MPQYFCVQSNPPLNAVPLTVFEFITFHESLELLPYGGSSEHYTGDIETTERITVVLVGITFTNILFWVEVAKEDLRGGTITSSLFPQILWSVQHC